jgi:hypothetical protein
MTIIGIRFENLSNDKIAATADELGCIMDAYAAAHDLTVSSHETFYSHLESMWEDCCQVLRDRGWTDDDLATHVHCPY